jgi:hypothetical protein
VRDRRVGERERGEDVEIDTDVDEGSLESLGDVTGCFELLGIMMLTPTPIPNTISQSE